MNHELILYPCLTLISRIPELDRWISRRGGLCEYCLHETDHNHAIGKRIKAQKHDCNNTEHCGLTVAHSATTMAVAKVVRIFVEP